MLALYIHYPYCRALCTYCAFNKYPISSDTHATAVEDARLRQAYVNETRTALRSVGNPRIGTIYFGGGTPSLASIQWFEDILNVARAEGQVDEGAEITVEANPAELAGVKMHDLARLGVNRLSIGVQSLRDSELRALGRDHSAQTAKQSIANACRIFGSHGVSLDMIWGRPAQTLEAWRRGVDRSQFGLVTRQLTPVTELQELRSIAPDHLSLYQLTLERGTPLFRAHQRRALPVPGTDTSAAFFDVTAELTEQYGFHHYETSSFARNARYGRHNLAYWFGHDYVGVGPGAHGRFWRTGADGVDERVKTVRIPHPRDWADGCMSARKEGLARTEKMSKAAVAQELFAFGLRTQFGVAAKRFRHHARQPDMWQHVDQGMVRQLCRDGFLTLNERDGDNETHVLRCTKTGAAVLDSILVRIFK